MQKKASIWMKILIPQIFLLLTTIVSANISGTVYRDYNINAIQDSLEPGIEGIIVHAYDNSGAITTTVTTDINGTFNLETAVGKYRIEIEKPSYLFDTADGSTSAKPSVFAIDDGASSLKIGLHNPSDYEGDNLRILAVTHSGGSISAAADNPSLREYDYNPTNANNTEDGVDNLSKVSDTGLVWGLAYAKTAQKAYTSASLRRHADISPDGLGAIYVTDLSDPTNPSTSLFTTVPNAGTVPSAADRNINGASDPSHDPVFSEIANMGLGDTDISEDEKTLYTINLATQELIEIDIATLVQINHTIDNPFGSECPDDDVKSWGLEPHDGAVYIGSVCSSNMSTGAAVSKWDGTSFTTVHTVDLTYERQRTLDWDTEDGEPTPNANWASWNNIYNPPFDGTTTDNSRLFAKSQPILSDIEFTEESGMVLGFIDRTSFQAGYDNYSPDTADLVDYEYDAGGDTLRICKVNGVYITEGDAGCETHQNKDGRDEYFIGDKYMNSDTSYVHNEVSLGGLLHKQGDTSVATIAYDSVNNHGDEYAYNRSGTSFYDMTSGEQIGGQLLNGGGTAVGQYAGFAKTGGMGDIEILGEPAPIEIGNYVWDDANGNGIQDPDETPIVGVKVYLYEGTVLIGTATTDSDGHYYFGGPDDTNGHVESNTDYQLRIDLNDAALADKDVTIKDAGINDGADSDGDNGTLNAGFSTIAYTTGSAGENNHDLDFGFANIVEVSIGSLVWDDVNKNGLQDATETGISGAIITLLDGEGNPIADIPTQETNSTGLYYFGGLPEGARR